MENCLLCMESRKVDCIEVNSEIWNQQEIQFLIEKHFWPMDTIKVSCWICLECAQELRNFHKFYTRIEQAHTNLAGLVKLEDEKPISSDEKDSESNFDCKEMSDRYDSTESNIEPEIVMEQLMSAEFELDVTSIKSENEDVEVSLKCRRRKGLISKGISSQNVNEIKDPLEKTKKSKQTKILVNKTRKLRSKTKKTSCSKNKLLDSQNLETSVNQPETLESSLGIVKTKSLSKLDEKDDTDSVRNDEKKSTKNINKRHNPDGDTLKEYDRIIADNFQIECNICQISFQNFIALRKHFKEEHNQRGYARCCNRNFFSRSVLVDHIYVHLNPEHFKCQECGKVFSDRSVLVNHIKLHEDVSKLLKCDKCGKAFVNFAVLRNHLLTHSSEKMFPCTICGKFFTNSSILNHHIGAVHQNKFVQICYICGKSLRCPTAFASHMEKHEVKTTPISCDVCGLLLSNKMGLKRHKNSQHPEGGKKEHKCHICLKISPTLRALKSHIQRTHEMGYDYKCSLCEKAFKRPAVLREHMATHTGTPLYSCPFCPKTFISNGNMYNHRKNSHPKEWEELQRQKYVDNLINCIMDFCLLCLETNKSIDGCIEVNSEKWNYQNMKVLIDKHLWPMELKSSSWICKACGAELYEFHKFYKRIEVAQLKFGAVLKNENVTTELNQKDFIDSDSSQNPEDCKDNLFAESHLEPHIVMEEPLPTEFIIDGPFIKSEKIEEIGQQDIVVKQNRKRGRPAKEMSHDRTEIKEDPLKKTKRRISKISSTKKIKSDQKLQIAFESDTSEENQIDPHIQTDNLDDVKSSPTFRDKKENNDSETDPENCEEKQTLTETVKKKNHRNLDEKTLKEYDKIIADNFKIFCNICQSALDNFLSLRRHFKLEHKQRGYARCCKRNFFTRSLLVDHIHVHLNPEYFKCLQCSKVFSDRSRLQCHKRLHDDDSKLDKCDICGKLFADKGALKKHVLTHSSEKLFPCSICGKFFTNSFILNHHIEAVHQNKFVQICDICGKSIRCPTAFASHMEKHEVKSTPISCDVCGLLLSNKEGLKRHKNSQHPEGGKKEHTCHICSKVSPTQRALKSHIRSVHEQGFDYKCSLCEKSFKRPAVLREHMATHTGTALYTCLWCPRTFISNGNMYNHRKNAHPKEWEELKRQKYAGNIS
ncbi:zinc finger protein Xfin-like [Calliphora vicina]|uniref:zinc finger protein Xfin-like n=1 Tax=Calliphora vicina TaxID=7373 RepID=UPI00325A47DD